MALEEVARHKAEMLVPAKEILEHLYRAVLATPPITLNDGRVATVAAFMPPQANPSGEAECGIDVDLPDGGHLEFTMRNSGWGRPLPGLLERLRRRDGNQAKPPSRE